MSSANIQAKIKKGLAKAVSKTGSASSEKVYHVSKCQTGNTPLNTGATINGKYSKFSTKETLTELVNAVFIEFDKSVADIDIMAGDRLLVSDNDVDIKQNDIIRQGATNYIVIEVDKVSPTSDVLVYKSRLRVQ
jgi:hypothetical protein